ncbi:MAG TPA: nucleotidyltransferase family protein [Conexivisphaerales archaeon]|nr:nucleotidyltransferase family protein [Conexivisphaerales archaeon]
MKPIYLMVLAAGLSIRFGRNKLVEEVEGVPIVARVVGAGQAAGLKSTAVVTGHERDKVIKALSSMQFEEVFNPDYAQGMSTSIRAGVAHLKDKARAIVISPGDMAFTTPRLYRMVLAEFARSRNDIVVASFKGRNGHPILFDRTTYNDLLKISEEKRGMKEVVQKFKDTTTYVETATPRALLDIDYQADFERAARELELENHHPER